MSQTEMPPQAAQREFALSEAEYENFKRDGYFGPFTVYEPEEMTKLWRRERMRLMDRTNAVYKGELAESGNTNISNYDRHLDSTMLADHICRPEIVDRVASVLGPDVICWRTEFFPKYPGDEGTDWHQADNFAIPSGRPQLRWPGGENVHFGGTITVWTAFTPATIETGCLQFVPGSHHRMMYDETRQAYYQPERINRQDKNGVRRGFFGYDYRAFRKDEHFEVDESQAIPMVLQPGQAVLFWSTLMHASHPHQGTTDQMRLGYAARYVPTAVDVYPNTTEIVEYGGSVSLERYGAVLVSGQNDNPSNRMATHTTTGHPFTVR